MNIWFNGNISDAITYSHTEKKVVVIAVINDDDSSKQLIDMLNNDLSELLISSCTPIMLKDNTQDMDFFKQLYKENIIFPSIFLFNNSGLSDVISGDGLNVENLTTTIVRCTFSMPLDLNKPQQPPQQTITDVESAQRKLQQIKDEKQKELDSAELKRREENRELLREKARREEIQRQKEMEIMEQERIAEREYAEVVKQRVLQEKEEQKRAIKEQEEKLRLEEEQRLIAEEERKKSLKDKVQIAFRLPSGESVRSVFDKDDTVQCCFDFLETKGYKEKQYDLIDSLKRTPLTDKSLLLAKYYPSIVFHVVAKKKDNVVKEVHEPPTHQSPPSDGHDDQPPTGTQPKNKVLRFMKGFLTGK